MPEPTDIVQVMRVAVVRVLNANADIQAITGRTTRNIVEWEPEAIVERPVIAYQFIVGSELAADGDTREMEFQFSASAATDATAHELLGAVERALTQISFLSLAVPLDAMVIRRFRRTFDLDVTFRVSRPTEIATIMGIARILEDASPRLMEDGFPRLLEAA